MNFLQNIVQLSVEIRFLPSYQEIKTDNSRPQPLIHQNSRMTQVEYIKQQQIAQIQCAGLIRSHHGS